MTLRPPPPDPRTLHDMTRPLPAARPTAEPQMVDWELRGLARGEGGRGGTDDDPRRGGLRRRRAPRRSVRSTGLVRDFTGLDARRRHGADAGRRPAGLGARQCRGLRDRDRTDDAQAGRQEGAEPDRPGRRVQDHRRRGGRPARLPRQQGARPVRPVLRPVGQAAAGRPQHRARRARARRRPDRLPALGVPARGDAPGAVHRGALDARPPVLRDRGDQRDRSSRARCSRAASTGSPTRSRTAARRQHRRHVQHPRASGRSSIASPG